MKTKIQAVNFSADKSLEEFIGKKLDKLETYYDKIIDADIYLKTDKNEKKNNKVVEIKLNVPGNDMFASQKSHSFEAATDEATEALRRQIKKFKEKQMGH